MEKKNKVGLIVILCAIPVLFIVFIISSIWIFLFTFGTKEPTTPPPIGNTEILLIQSLCGFDFPESTSIIKTYNTESSLYVSFGFDKEDKTIFMESLNWERRIEGDFRGELGWQDTVSDDHQLWEFTRPIFKSDYVGFFGDSKEPHGPELEWWHPNKDNIEKIFWMADAKIENANLWLDLAIILEKQEDTYRVYAHTIWHEAGGASFIGSVYNYFPLYTNWEARDRESKPYPTRPKDKDIERNIR